MMLLVNSDLLVERPLYLQAHPPHRPNEDSSLAKTPSIGKQNKHWQRSWLHYRRNSKFCITVSPVARTASVRTQSVKGIG